MTPTTLAAQRADRVQADGAHTVVCARCRPCQTRSCRPRPTTALDDGLSQSGSNDARHPRHIAQRRDPHGGEAVSHSCLVMTRGDYAREGRYDIPREFRHCSSADMLCPACRIFGWMERGEVWLGNVSIGDALSPEGQHTLGSHITLLPLSAPKPHHDAFYDPSIPAKCAAQVLLHHPQAAQPSGVLTTPRRTDQNRTVQPALTGSAFTFKVDYTDLADDELGLLLYSLALEDGVCHKIGLGKPAGLGSAQIEIVALTEHDLLADVTASWAAV